MIVAVLVAWLLIAAAVRIRRTVRPCATAMGDLVADVVIALTLATAMAQAAGAVGILHGEVVLAAAVIVFASVHRWMPAPSAPRYDRFASADAADAGAVASIPGAVLGLAVAAVGAQWTSHLLHANAHGMVQADNLWYHGPFVATIRQTGGLGSFGELGYPESRFFPLNTHVVDAMLTMPTGTDVLVPFVNHLHAALFVVAASVIGRRFGAAVPAAMVAVVVLSLPLVASTQPGQMYNDVAATSLLVAAAALWCDRRRSTAPTASVAPTGVVDVGALLALVAIGLAISTKLTVLAPAAVLAAGILAYLARDRGYRFAAAGAVLLVATGGVWFFRNLLISGSPAPYAHLGVGPIGFDRQTPEPGPSLIETLDDPSEFGGYYRDAIDISFGPLWWFVLVAALLGVATALSSRRHGDRRLIALAAGVGFVVYPFVPLTGGLAFVNNLRYLLPSLTFALIVLAVTAARFRRGPITVVAAGAVVIAANLMSEHRGRVEAWPSDAWPVAAASAVLVVGLTALWLTGALGRFRRASSASPTMRRPGVVAGAVVSVVAIAGVSMFEDAALDGRYGGDDLEDAPLYQAMASAADDATHVDVFGVVETYPLFGQRFEHTVEVHNDVLAIAPEHLLCSDVRGRLGDEVPGYIVIGSYWTIRDMTPSERFDWFERDPSVEAVFDDGVESVLRRDAVLLPGECLGG